MRLVITDVDRKTARKTLSGFKTSYVVDIREHVLEHEYVRGEVVADPAEYLANRELEKRLSQAAGNRRSSQVVYLHYDLNRDLVFNLIEFYAELGADVEFVVFDPSGKNPELYPMFDEVMEPLT